MFNILTMQHCQYKFKNQAMRDITLWSFYFILYQFSKKFKYGI